MKLKFITAITLILSLAFSVSVSADVLGTVIGSSRTNFGAGTYLNNIIYESNQASVGQQTEYYVEYTPNSDAVPVVENGVSVWGTRTITNAAEYIENKGYRPLIGVNADFFSFTTGIAMGSAISEGEILTKTDGKIDAVGFRADGSAFIKPLDIQTKLNYNGESVNVECINRWYTKDYTPVCLLTDKFGTATHTESECLFLLCTPVGGKLSIGETQTLHVDDKFMYDGNVSIPDGKMVLLISKYGDQNLFEFLNSIEVGAEITIQNSADSIWNDAENAIGSAAGPLLKNGAVSGSFEAGTAPRTAVGICPDGTVIFYVIDGRQYGYSYGARLETIAARMKELGCIDAINLDGGGSTAIGGVYPGSSTFSVFNSPSDGNLRSCANYIFLKDSRKPTGIPYSVNFIDDENKNYLSGTSMKVTFNNIYDTGGYAMNNILDIVYEAENTGGSKTTVDEDGTYHFKGRGETTVKLKTDNTVLTGFTYEVFEEPDNLRFFNQTDGKEVGEIYLKKGEEYSVNLTVKPYVNGTELHSDDTCFKWSVKGDIGSIDSDGNFIAKTNGDKAGKIIVKCGKFEKELNVFVSDYSPEQEVKFADIEGHWAQGRIENMADSGIINGIELDGKIYFKPNENMTRAEFAQIIMKYMGYKADKYSMVRLPYLDNDEIQPWAQNAVKSVYANNIMSGRSEADGIYFAPDSHITRAEAMTVLGRLLNSDKEKHIDFADKEDIPQWAKTEISRLYAAGIIQGYSDNTIKPNANVKRAEAITMIANFNTK